MHKKARHSYWRPFVSLFSTKKTKPKVMLIYMISSNLPASPSKSPIAGMPQHSAEFPGQPVQRVTGATYEFQIFNDSATNYVSVVWKYVSTYSTVKISKRSGQVPEASLVAQPFKFSCNIMSIKITAFAGFLMYTVEQLVPRSRRVSSLKKP